MENKTRLNLIKQLEYFQVLFTLFKKSISVLLFTPPPLPANISINYISLLFQEGSAFMLFERKDKNMCR